MGDDNAELDRLSLETINIAALPPSKRPGTSCRELVCKPGAEMYSGTSSFLYSLETQVSISTGSYQELPFAGAVSLTLCSRRLLIDIQQSRVRMGDC